MIDTGEVAPGKDEKKGAHLSLIATKWKGLNAIDKQKYQQLFNRRKIEWENEYGPISEYRKHRKRILKRKRDEKESRQHSSFSAPSARTMSSFSSASSSSSSSSSSSTSSSSSSSTPLQKNYNRSSNNWKTPVTSRQRRWVNRPATNALDSKVFGVYPLSDVEHMCRVIYKYLTGQGPTTIAIDWRQISTNLPVRLKWTPEICRTLWKYAAYGLDVRNEADGKSNGNINGNGNSNGNINGNGNGNVAEDVSDDEEIAASVGVGFDPPEFVTERRQKLQKIDKMHMERKRLVAQQALEQQRNAAFQEQQQRRALQMKVAQAKQQQIVLQNQRIQQAEQQRIQHILESTMPVLEGDLEDEEAVETVADSLQPITLPLPLPLPFDIELQNIERKQLPISPQKLQSLSPVQQQQQQARGVQQMLHDRMLQ